MGLQHWVKARLYCAVVLISCTSLYAVEMAVIVEKYGSSGKISNFRNNSLLRQDWISVRMIPCDKQNLAGILHTLYPSKRGETTTTGPELKLHMGMTGEGLHLKNFIAWTVNIHIPVTEQTGLPKSVETLIAQLLIAPPGRFSEQTTSWKISDRTDNSLSFLFGDDQNTSEFSLTTNFNELRGTTHYLLTPASSTRQRTFTMFHSCHWYSKGKAFVDLDVAEHSCPDEHLLSDRMDTLKISSEDVDSKPPHPSSSKPHRSMPHGLNTPPGDEKMLTEKLSRTRPHTITGPSSSGHTKTSNRTKSTGSSLNVIDAQKQKHETLPQACALTTGGNKHSDQSTARTKISRKIFSAQRGQTNTFFPNATQAGAKEMAVQPFSRQTGNDHDKGNVCIPHPSMRTHSRHSTAPKPSTFFSVYGELDDEFAYHHAKQLIAYGVKEMPELANWHKSEEIGSGSFGKVYRMFSPEPGSDYSIAVKKVTRNSEGFYALRREAAILLKLEHDSIIRVLGFASTSKEFWLALEFAPSLTLYDHLMQNSESFHEDMSCEMLLRILQAITYMQGLGIVHRDLKPENIMVDIDDDLRLVPKERVKSVKIIDFGFAAIQKMGQKLRRSIGSPSYAAPELFIGKTVYDGKAADIYSYGSLAYVCLTKNDVFPGVSKPLQLRSHILSGSVRLLSERSLEEVSSTSARDIIRQSCQRNARNRPSAHNLLKHKLWVEHIQKYTASTISETRFPEVL